MALVLTAALTLPFTPHTTAELADWETDWSTRVEAIGWDLTVELADEYSDMTERHPCFPEACLAAPAVISRAPTGAAPPPTGMGSNVEQWRSKVGLYFPVDQVDRALRIMACESGGNPSAYNPSGASGLMQVLASWADNFGYTPQQLFDPDVNLYVASLLYYDGGWGHWVCKG